MVKLGLPPDPVSPRHFTVLHSPLVSGRWRPSVVPGTESCDVQPLCFSGTHHGGGSLRRTEITAGVVTKEI